MIRKKLEEFIIWVRGNKRGNLNGVKLVKQVYINLFSVQKRMKKNQQRLLSQLEKNQEWL